MKICVQGTITGMKSMRDNTWRLQVDTQEIAPEDIASITTEINKFGYFVFQAGEPIRELDLEELPSPKTGPGKSLSKSQILRFALHGAWNAGTKEKDFPTFYQEHMDKIINHITKSYEPRSTI